jgi:small subunit ribosomal protein S6
VADNRYLEVTVIVNGALEEETIQQVIDRTSEFITRNGATITVADHWGRKRLAYPINKKHTGYYVQYGLDAPPALAPQLERFFHLEEHIIRHLILSLTEKDLRTRDEMRARLAAAEAAEAAEEEAAAAAGGERRERPREQD